MFDSFRQGIADAVIVFTLWAVLAYIFGRLVADDDSGK